MVHTADVSADTHKIGAAARMQFAGAVLRSFVLFAFQWLVARAYGPGPFGIANLALSGFQTAAMLGRAAGDNVVLRAQTTADRQEAFSLGVSISLWGGLLAGMGLWVSGLALSGWHPSSPTATSFLLAAFAVPSAAVLFPLGAGLRREGRFTEYTLVATLLEPIVRLLLVVLAIVIGAHWTASVASITAASTITALVGLSLLRSELKVVPTLHGHQATRLFAYSGTMTLAAALNTGFLFVQLSLLTLLGLQQQTGIFAAAGRIALLALWIQWAFSAPFTPLIAQRLAHSNDASDLENAYQRVVAGVLWVNSPFLVSMVVSAPAILGIFGSTFQSGAVLLVILAAGQWVNSATALAEEFLPLSSRSGLTLVNNLGAVLLLVALGIPLGMKYGVIGVGLASSVAVIGVNIVRAKQVAKMFRVALPGRTIAKAGVASLIAAAVFLRTAWSLIGRPSLQFALGALAAALTIALMWLTSSHDDRTTLRGLLLPRRPATDRLGESSRRAQAVPSPPQDR